MEDRDFHLKVLEDWCQLVCASYVVIEFIQPLISWLDRYITLSSPLSGVVRKPSRLHSLLVIKCCLQYLEPSISPILLRNTEDTNKMGAASAILLVLITILCKLL